MGAREMDSPCRMVKGYERDVRKSGGYTKIARDWKPNLGEDNKHFR